MGSVFFAALPSILCAVIMGVLGFMAKSIKAIGGEVKASNKATFVMLQDRILQSCKEHQARGYLPAHEGEMLHNLFKQYKAMHGNGYVAAQVEETMKLPQYKEVSDD